MDRRQFLKAFGKLTVAFAVGGGGLYQYSVNIEPENLVIEKVQIPIKNLKPALEGFTIVQLSDFHVDAYTKIETIQKAVTMANSLKPDIIVLTGDFVHENSEAIFDLTPILATLNAKYGLFTILGNHDYWTNSNVVKAGLEKIGVPVLVNEGLTIGVGREKIYLAGLDDIYGEPDLNSTLNNQPSDTLSILLAHEPDIADTITLDGRVSLQLSGHTHGGQVRLPGVGAILLPAYGEKYDMGLYDINGMWLYTNRGIGVAPLPYRVNCPPEVTEITLVRA